MVRFRVSALAVVVGIALMSGLVPYAPEVSAQTQPRYVTITGGHVTAIVGQTVSFGATFEGVDVTATSDWRTLTPSTVSSLGGGRFEAKEPGLAVIGVEEPDGHVGNWTFVVVNANGGVLGQGGIPAQFLGTLLAQPLCSLKNCTLEHPNLYLPTYTGNRFVVSGETTGDGKQGLWAFTESGQSAGVGNLYADIGKTSANSREQSISPVLKPNGSQGFIHSTQGAAYYTGPLTYYEFPGGQIDHRSQAYAWDYRPPGSGGRPSYREFAVAGGYLFATYSSPDAETVVYRLPEFTEVSRGSISFRPIIGVGDFLVAASANYQGSPRLYKVDSSGNATLVRELPELVDQYTVGAYDIDHSKNPLEISFHSVRSSRNSETEPMRILTYRVTADSFEKVREQTFRAPSGASFNHFANHSGIALSGEFAAFAMGWDRGRNEMYGIGIYRNGEFTGFVPLPVLLDSETGVYGAEFQPAHDISPSGRMMVVNSFGAQIWQLGSTGGNPWPTGPTTGTGGPPSPGPIPPGGFPPTAPTTPLPTIPGQMFNVTYSPTSTAPQVLSRFMNITAIGPQNLTASIFGETYDIRLGLTTSILNSAWAPTTLTEFQVGSFANVWGTLDPSSGTVIRAITLRNPIPAGAVRALQQPSLTTGTGTGSGTNFSATPTGNSDALNALNSLQSILQGLQQRLTQ